MHVIGWDTLEGNTWYLLHSDEYRRCQCIGHPPVDEVYESPIPSDWRMREDSLGNIWTKFGTDAPILHYAFPQGIGVGDTIFMSDHNAWLPIDSIDTVWIGMQPRMRFWSTCGDPWQPEYVIEGIGFNMGFFQQWWSCNGPVWDNYLSIVCYMQGGDTLGIDTAQACGFPPHHPLLSVAEPDVSGQPLSWMPAQSLVMGAGVDEGTAWRLYDVTGRLVDAGWWPGSSLELEIGRPGLYLFQLEGSRLLRCWVP